MKQRVLVVGGGRLVEHLGHALTDRDHGLTVINRSREECVRLGRALRAEIIEGDGSDPAILEEAGAANVDMVLALTERDDDNLMVCQIARRRFLVPRTLALVNAPQNEDVFRRLGLGIVFSPARVLAELIEQRSVEANVIDLLPLAEGRVTVSEIRVAAGSAAAGVTLAALPLPAGAVVACILRGEASIVPSGATTLEADDRVIVVTTRQHHVAVTALLTKAE